MNKTNFALSWGRKVFFSLGLILTFICGATYLSSKVFPSDVLGWVYFGVTFIGWYGLLLSGAYFILFRFFAKVSPSYYVLRFSSLFILIVLNTLILFDSYLFTHYQVHLSMLILNLIQDEYFFRSIGITNILLVSLIGGFFIFSLVFWIQSENVWRTMQARFSNPTSNWYIGVFIICFLTSQFIYVFGSVHKISNYFFLPQVLQVTDLLKDKVGTVVDLPKFQGGEVKNVFYPKRNLKCSKNPEHSVLMIKLNKLSSEHLNAEVMPHLLHLKDHGMSLENHHGTASNVQDADFSITYSIPAFYQNDLMKSKKSPLELVLEKSSYEVIKLNNPEISQLNEYFSNEKFFIEMSLTTEEFSEADKKIHEIMETLNNLDKVSQTIIIITGKTGLPQIPTIMIWPDKNDQNISKFTSHYDFVPTLLEENFGCKNKVTDYSFGTNIFSKNTPSRLYVSHGNELEIFDMQTQSVFKTDLSTINPFPKGEEIPKFMMAIEQLHYFNSPSL